MPPRADKKRPPADQASRLRDAQDRFVAVWGQMAAVWGISRTMAEAHALLYITGAPLCADDIIERLQISRGNASMSLRALLEWGVVERTHRRGDRKEYFQAQSDVWDMFRAIVRERVKREVDPMLASLYDIRELTPGAGGDEESQRHAARLDAMIDFFSTVERLSRIFVSPAGPGLQGAASMLDAGAENGGEPGQAGGRR